MDKPGMDKRAGANNQAGKRAGRNAGRGGVI